MFRSGTTRSDALPPRSADTARTHRSVPILPRLGLIEPNGFGSLGAELRLTQEDPATGGGVGRDPGIGGYVGIGVMPRHAGPMGLFAELGARASLVMGEYTQGGGAYLTAVVGLMFGG